MIKFVFTEENQNLAKEIIAKYPKNKQESAVMPLLDLAQRQNDNHLNVAAMDYVASLLDMSPIRVYEVAHFYTMYNKKPVGKYHIQICTNISCWLRGSDKIVETCLNELNVGIGETTKDNLFTVSEVECLGACSNAPMMQVNDDYYEDLTAETTKRILSDFKAGKTPKSGSQIGRKSAEPCEKSKEFNPQISEILKNSSGKI